MGDDNTTVEEVECELTVIEQKLALRGITGFRDEILEDIKSGKIAHDELVDDWMQAYSFLQTLLELK